GTGSSAASATWCGGCTPTPAPTPTAPGSGSSSSPRPAGSCSSSSQSERAEGERSRDNAWSGESRTSRSSLVRHRDGAPVSRPDRALLLTPGASATRDHSALVAIERVLAPVPVERIDLARGRKAEALVATVVDAAGALATGAKLAPGRIALGGRSLGGRVCSLAVAGGLPALALVLVS